MDGTLENGYFKELLHRPSGFQFADISNYESEYDFIIMGADWSFEDREEVSIITMVKNDGDDYYTHEDYYNPFYQQYKGNCRSLKDLDLQ